MSEEGEILYVGGAAMSSDSARAGGVGWWGGESVFHFPSRPPTATVEQSAALALTGPAGSTPLPFP